MTIYTSHGSNAMKSGVGAEIGKKTLFPLWKGEGAVGREQEEGSIRRMNIHCNSILA